ncbi:hypothetical protein M0805_006135 [Coniferiporia weirii]|nr:hypothetical protein M0805_006135 [Coniferiporia weirii]
MQGSSELSDALNPFFYRDAHSTSLPALQNYDQHLNVSAAPNVHQQQQQTAAPPYTPHRSELADAINPTAVSPVPLARPAPPKQSRQSPTDPMQLLKGLIQSLASYKAAVECEKKRRITWEQEQEGKYIARQVELEARIVEMQQEIDSLKTVLSATQTLISPSLSAQHMSSGSGQIGIVLTPVLHEMQTFEQQPEFIQGSSVSPPLSRKRARSGSPNNMALHYEPMKLRTHRDSKPQTIQAAMRNHILRSMDLEHDKELPVSHIEGAPHALSEPVRFVWEQTTKKSPHNGKMKARVVTDMMANKELYPFVPAQEFTKPKLESVFEQAFTTLRQKYISQKGDEDASNHARERVGVKARRARRVSRKKIKLANRITTRKKFSEYSVSLFDAAFQMECMSSEESDEGEGDEPDGYASSDGERLPAHKVLNIRYLAWRSSRLTQLFHAIDAREEVERSAKPKRGVGRKDRRMGAPKDGNPFPPKGVSRWMVSKRWLWEASATSSRIAELLRDIVLPNGDDDSAVVSGIGNESEDEDVRQWQRRGQEKNYVEIQGPVMGPTPLVPLQMSPDHLQQYYLHTQQAQWGVGLDRYVGVPDFAAPYAAGLPDAS